MRDTCRLSDLVTRCRPQIAKLSFGRHLDSRTADTLDIVIVPLSDGEARRLSFVWLDEEIFPRKYSIRGETFIKQ